MTPGLPPRARASSALLCVVFAASGAAALVFETLWFHQAGLAFGNSIWASSLVLAAFMGGLALGNGLVGRFGQRVRRPVRMYAWLEAAIAASGIALVHALPLLSPILSPWLRALADEPWALAPLRVATAFFLLVAPSTAMGATLPLLVGALYRRDPRFGRVLGLLYGWNTAGAVAGAVLTEAVLVGALGIRGSAVVAGLLNATALVGALALAPTLDAAPPPPAAAPAPLTNRARVLLAAAFACGAALLALEVVWFRLLLLKVLGTSLAFALMLAVVLAGIALGGLAGSALLSRRPEAFRAAAPAAFAAAALVAVTYALHGFGLASQPGVVFQSAGLLWLAVPLMGPVSIVSGALFTFLGEALHREGIAETRAAGLLTLANTTGAMLGPLLGGFLLLPRLGIEVSVQILAWTYAAAGVALAAAAVRPRGRAVLAAAVLACAAALLAFPRGALRERYLADTLERFRRNEGAYPVAVREGLTETAVYLRSDLFGEPLYHRLVTNAHSMSGTDVWSRRYMKIFVWWPVAVHPEPRTALLISFGVGSTAQALVDTRELTRIDVVDVSRDILELADVVHPDGRNPLRDPRVRVHVEDGRHFLQTTQDRFDLITGEPPPPKAAGIVNLYTREYFELLRSRLAEGGIATYWLPVHTLLEAEAKAIMAAFCAAFGDCSLWAGSRFDWMLVGTRDARGPVSAERFAAQWRDPRVGPELRDLGLEQPEQLGTLFLLGAEDLVPILRGVAVLDDDHPRRLSHRVLGAPVLASTWTPWLRVEQARQRFQRSEIGTRLWPSALREATAAWFWTRAAGGLSDGKADFEMLHSLLAAEPLSALPLWELGSNGDRQRAARAALGRRDAYPGLTRELALGALAERRFGEAADLLARSRADGAAADSDAVLEIYALCRAGRPDAARERAAALRGTARPSLSWLRRRLDPRCVEAPGPA